MINITRENITKIFVYSLSKELTPLPHLHNEIEIIYVFEGEAIVFVDQKSQTLKSGDLFIAFPNQVHFYEESVKGKYLVLLFSADILFELKKIMYNNLPNTNILRNIPNSEIVSLLNKMLETNGNYSRTKVVGILNEVMALLLPETGIKQRIKSDNATLQSVLNYCTENFSSELTLDNVAKALHISKYHISHLLNNKLGIGFNNYLNTIRINAACSLLRNTNQKVAEISEEVGFGSIRSFNRAFLKIMNISPLIYRNKTNPIYQKR